MTSLKRKRGIEIEDKDTEDTEYLHKDTEDTEYLHKYKDLYQNAFLDNIIARIIIHYSRIRFMPPFNQQNVLSYTIEEKKEIIENSLSFFELYNESIMKSHINCEENSGEDSDNESIIDAAYILLSFK